ncbi:uncharacterized protein LOC111918856 [Lactuca sativa]|uniref:Uncharacterized protein n=1 Tax=Lactuca sativa TaxID=4236 RepID=A0A9R1XJM2_LACSA|nr:uncharacterized protein LOC111918856 [Lactuca sativa]XP_023770236.1 uncharacterized protein LOC111918856 [Lactuca sativa]KAJ0215571.1 hypothetical protein LSAT_V11C300128570 [Lactuca sativa]
MEANVCDVNRLDSDVLLPPRKRLLACLKKQNGDINGSPNSPSTCTPLSKLDTRISYLLRAHLSTDNPSQEEIVAASRSAAEVAVKVAMAARAAAEEKAVIASKAMAAAKKALELVAIVDDQNQETPSSPEQDSNSKKNKQVEVQMLYNNKKPRLENGNKTNDEELARKLHQAINSSPRISKSGVPLPSELKAHNNNKLKKLSENGIISNGSIVVEGIYRNDKKAEEDITTNGERERIQTQTQTHSKVKSCDDDMSMTSFGRKRGRMKQKKLPLSICHDRDQLQLQANPNPNPNPNPKEVHDHHPSSKTSLSVGMPPGNNVVERNLWKCQAFKASPCVKQNKVMQL